MVTPNKALEQPANGSFVNIWDQPLNNNMSIIDRAFGGVANIALSGTGVSLSLAQYQCAIIRLTGFLTAEIPIQLPPNVGGVWTFINECSNFNNAVPYVYTGLGNYCGLPPGNVQIVSDGANVRYISLPPVGTYLTVASNNYPRWILLNPILPYLNCDGSGFNTTSYQRLAEYLGFGSLPDLRGRAHYTTDQGTGRVTAVIAGGFTGAGGDQNLQSHGHGYSNGFSVYTSNSVDDINHTHTYYHNSGGQLLNGPFTPGNLVDGADTTSGPNIDINVHRHVASATFSGGTDAGGTIGTQQNMPPAYMMGLTLIRTGYP